MSPNAQDRSHALSQSAKVVGWEMQQRCKSDLRLRPEKIADRAASQRSRVQSAHALIVHIDDAVLSFHRRCGTS